MSEIQKEKETTQSGEGLLAEKYYQACHLMSETAYAGSDGTEAISQLETLTELFGELGDYSDSKERLEKCSRRLEKLKEKKAADDEKRAEEAAQKNARYAELREDAKRAEKILKKRDASKRLEDISKELREKYSDIEGAEDYAREYAEKSVSLMEAYNRRKRYEVICCIAACFLVVLTALIYILMFSKQGSNYRPLIPLTVCDCIAFASFMIGYHCESESGTAASVIGAAGLAACFIATALLCIFKRPPLGLLGYIELLFLPIVIGFFAGVVLYVTWGIFARRIERPAKTRWDKK